MARTLESVVRHCSAHRRLALLAGVLAASFVMLAPSESSAQTIIKNPGDHKKYVVELEPHGLLMWQSHYDAGYGYYDNGFGWGAGFRAAIPVTHNGFLPMINNSVAVGFGMDWGHYSYSCWYGRDRHDPYWGQRDCTGNEFWFPVVMQWNFYITKFFSAFVEPGLAVYHTRWSYPKEWCNASTPWYCDTWSHTGVYPVAFIGGRLGNDTVSFTFRIGYPYISLGASFML
jgi:hypothetical protein